MLWKPNSISNITKRSWKVAFLIWLELGNETTSIIINCHTTKSNVEQKQILWKPRCYELHNPFQNSISVLIVKNNVPTTWIVSGQYLGFLFPYYIIDQKHLRNILPSLNNNMNWNRITYFNQMIFELGHFIFFRLNIIYMIIY